MNFMETTFVVATGTLAVGFRPNGKYSHKSAQALLFFRQQNIHQRFIMFKLKRGTSHILNHS